MKSYVIIKQVIILKVYLHVHIKISLTINSHRH